jgi:uncharacterized protein YyaL (SSP411 family)
MRQLYDVSVERTRSTGSLAPLLLERAFRGLARAHDVRNGGFGNAPKFPQAMALEFALAHWAQSGETYPLEVVHQSFVKMARGGIYDQIGGGFHRYAVDATWLTPHFEKMLYDNALLVRLGTHLWQATKDGEVRRVVDETIAWVAREMTSPEGGFYSSLDADSDGEEGKFYVWDEQEIDRLVGADVDVVKAYWGVSRTGNFEGRNILHVASDPRVVAARHYRSESDVAAAIAGAKTLLYAERAKRPWPGRDEKIIASWNGLMLRAIADAARVFGKSEWRALALSNGAFALRELVRDDRVMRSSKGGVAKIAGFLEDHASLALGLLALYELTFERAWLDKAQSLTAAIVDRFWDSETGAFYDTAHDHERLITRPRDVTDNATPAGTSLAVELLLRVSEISGDPDMRRRAIYVLETLAEPMAQHPSAFGHLLGAASMAVHGAVEVAIAGDPSDGRFDDLVQAVGARYLPSLVLAGGPADSTSGIALLDGRTAIGGAPTAYVCRDPDTLGAQLEKAARIDRTS